MKPTAPHQGIAGDRPPRMARQHRCGCRRLLRRMRLPRNCRRTSAGPLPSYKVSKTDALSDTLTTKERQRKLSQPPCGSAGFLPDGSAMSSYRLVSGFRRAGGMARLTGLQVLFTPPLPCRTA
jgi:hypothetical protein